MPLRTEIVQFKKHCDAMIALMTARPELLTEFERLDIESNIVRIMNAIVKTETAKLPPR